MTQQVFRQKSIERISSPEQLHDYIRVTSPRLWMLLAAIIALAVGMLIAAFTLQMENARNVQVTVSRENEGGEPAMSVYISLPLEQKDQIGSGMKIRVAGEEGKILYLFEDAEEIFAAVELNDPEKLLPEGTYEGQIVVEETTPISFFLN